MEFRILGPLQALSDGVPVDLGPHKQRCLLALLLLSANRVVSTDRILEELWGEDSTGKEKALWVHVSRLRSALEPARAERGESSVLLTRDHGYVLQITPDALDAHRFEAAVAEGRELLRDDAAAASVVLEDALAMWNGAALAEFTYEEFARAEISRLEELRLDATEHRIDADLRRGRTSELISELEQYREETIAGTRAVPRSPSGDLAPPPGVAPTATVTVTFDGSACIVEGPATFTPNGAVRLDFVNTTETDAVASVLWGDEYTVEVPAGPGASNTGYTALTAAGPHPVACRPEFGETTIGPALEWGTD